MKLAHFCAGCALAASINVAATVSARELPDLVVAEAALKATGQCAAGATVIAGTVRVRNAGKGRGQIFTTRDMLAARAPHVPGLKGAVKFVNSMRPGDVQTIALAIRASRNVKAKGPVAIEITVDPRNVFAEADEGNNTLTVKVVIDCR
jgi:CARDB